MQRPQRSRRACTLAAGPKLSTQDQDTIRQGFKLVSVMIPAQVPLRGPCYDFCPVQATAIKTISIVQKPESLRTTVLAFLETAQSRAATGGVYKGQGRNQRELMTHTYWEFLVQEK